MAEIRKKAETSFTTLHDPRGPGIEDGVMSLGACKLPRVYSVPLLFGSAHSAFCFKRALSCLVYDDENRMTSSISLSNNNEAAQTNPRPGARDAHC